MSNNYDFDGLNHHLLTRISDLLPRILPGGKFIGHEYMCGDIRGGSGDSLSVNINTGIWCDFAGPSDHRGDIISLYAKVHNLSNGEAFKQLAESENFQSNGKLPVTKSKPEIKQVKPPLGASVPDMHHYKYGNPTSWWCYRDIDGNAFFYIARYDTPSRKVFRPWSWSADGKWVPKAISGLRPLYGLEYLKINLNRDIVIVEGEKAADACRKIVGDTYTVLTWSTGSNGWKTSDWKPIRDLTVLLWPDADKSGRDAVKAIAALLSVQGCSIRIIDTEDKPDTWDAADALAEGMTWDELKAWMNERTRVYELLSEAEGVTSKQSNPEHNSSISFNSQATFEKKWPEPLKEDAFHGLLGDIVRTITPHSESDPAAILVQMLVVFGNIIGRSAYFRVEAQKHFLNIFSVLVGRTAKGRKGTALSHVKRSYKGIDGTWLNNRIPSGLSSGEGLIWAVRDKIIKRDPIKVKGKITGYQNLEVDQGISDKRLLVVESEFASTIRVLDRPGNILSPLIRHAWDDGMLETLTKNSPARATNAHLSLIGHITKNELRKYLDKTECANGFGNRFLWVCTERSKMLAEGGRLYEEDLGPLLRRLSEVVCFAKTVTEMKRDENARELWKTIYPILTKEVPGLFGAMTARAEAQVARLACIYALFDSSSLVRLEHLKAALSVWDYCEASAHFIFGDDLGDSTADTILAALRSHPDGLSRTDINNLFNRNLESNKISRALETLKEAGLAEMSYVKTSGRSQELWVAITKKTN